METMKKKGPTPGEDISPFYKGRNSWLPVSFASYAGFFIPAFVFFLFFADHVLYYQEKAFLFTFGTGFLKECLQSPGGILLWAEKFLVSFYFNPATGALALAGLLTLVVYFTSRTVSICGSRYLLLAFIPGLILFFLHTDYRFMTINSLGILFALASFTVAARFARGWFLVICAPLVFIVAGGFAWIYLALASSYLLLSDYEKRVSKTALLWLAIIIFVTSASEWIYFRGIKSQLLYPFSELNPGTHLNVFIGIALYISLLPVSIRIIDRAGRGHTAKYAGKGILLPAAVLLIMIMISLSKYDVKTRQYFETEKLFTLGRYSELIDYNTKHQPSNSLTVFLNNIALCETGSLNDRLFDFRQAPDGSTLFLKWEMIGEVLRRGAYFYYATGVINEAHRWAFENMVMKGPSPEGLKMLIRTELINGNTAVATKYINMLGRSLFYRKDAIHYGKFITGAAAPAADPELGPKMKVKLSYDFFSITDNPWINLQRVLDLDPLNRPAFDYRIAYLLLNKQYQTIAALLPEFRKLGYSRLPVNVEEAALAMAAMNNNAMPDLGGLNISPATVERWNRYMTIFSNAGSDRAIAEPALKREFGNTFWYYAFYK